MIDPDSPLERALQQLGSVIEARSLLNEGGGLVSATHAPSPISFIRLPAEASWLAAGAQYSASSSASVTGQTDGTGKGGTSSIVSGIRCNASR